MGEEERLDWSVWLESGNFGRRRERVPALYHGDGAVQPLDLDTRCYGVRWLGAGDAAAWAVRELLGSDHSLGER
jgi:hypothetical protein